MLPNKLLGQNFLRCQWVTEEIIKAAELSSEDIVLEIGPGEGVLTAELAKKSRKVIAVEKDSRLVDELKKSFIKKHPNVEIISGDILKILEDPVFVSRLQKHPYKVVANIPYYLTSRLIRVLLENSFRPELIVLTVQKEVAERIVALPPRASPVRSKTPKASADVPAHRTSNGTSLLSLSVQAFGNPEIVKSVPASCFYPRPKVDSAIIRVSGISDAFFKGHRVDPKKFFWLLRQVFTLKRKTILNALGKSWPKEERSGALKKAGIHPNRRPEEISLKEWAALVNEVCKK